MAASTSASLSVPPTPRALVLPSTRGPYDISVVQQATPGAEPGSAVVRILASAVLTYAGSVYSSRKPYPYPTPFVPARLPLAFDGFIEGRDDPTSLILHDLFAGFTPGSNALMEKAWRDGTYAEYAKLPLENCFLLDEARLLGSPFNGGWGHTAENLVNLWTISIPFGGLRDVDVKAGEKVIITPATGAFGSAAVLRALAMGALVIAMGRNVEALEHFKTFSSDGRVRIVQNTGDVDADVKELTKDGPADVFFDISPGKAVKSTHFKSCIKALRRGGRVSLMGAHEELPLPTQTITLSDLTVKGKWMYTKEDIRVMIKLVEIGYLRLGQAGGIRTVGTFPLEQFEQSEHFPWSNSMSLLRRPQT